MKKEVPIWEKSNLTLEEAAAYFGIDINKLRHLTDDTNCRYVLWCESKRLIKRKLLHEHLEKAYWILSEKEKQITDFVLNTFGIYNAWFLKDLTHYEEPWLVARKGIDENDVSRNIMDEGLIYDYFKRMNIIYNLKTADGIDLYVKDMKIKVCQ